MVFDKVKASVGIGSAEVDTILEQDRFVPGEPMPLRVLVEGGDADQKIDDLRIKLQVELKEDANEVGTTRTIDTYTVADDFVIEEGGKRVFDIEPTLHPETPINEVNSNVYDSFEGPWLSTAADIDMAIDPKDKDYLRIRPTEPMGAMMDAVERAGFDFRRLTTDPDRIKVGNVRSDLACDQEFVYRPRSGSHPSNLEEIELHFVPRPPDNKTHVLLEFDRHRGSESFRSMVIDHHDYSVDGLRDTFERNLRREF